MFRRGKKTANPHGWNLEPEQVWHFCLDVKLSNNTVSFKTLTNESINLFFFFLNVFYSD